MDNSTLHILLITADAAGTQQVQQMLTEAPAAPLDAPKAVCRLAGSLAEALTLVLDDPPDLILLDLALPDSSGLEALTRLRIEAPHIPALILADPGSEELAAQAVQAGALAYLLKGQVPRPLPVYLAPLARAARRGDRLLALNELDRALADAESGEAVVEATLEAVSRALDVQAKALLLFSPYGGGARVRGCFGEGDWQEGALSRDATQRWHALLEGVCAEGAVVSPDELAPVSELLGECLDLGGLLHERSMVIPLWEDGRGGEGERRSALMILASRSERRRFSTEELALARTCLERAGRALRDTRFYQSSQERLARMSTLNAISAAIVSSLEPDTVLRRVLGLTCEALDSVEGSILLKDRATSELVFALTRTAEQDFLSGRRLAPGQGIAGWIVEHGRPACVNNVDRDPRYYDGMVPITGITVDSLLGVPMTYRDEIIGVIEIINKRSGQFTDEDITLVEAVASFAAVALENARLYTATRERADELALLNTISLTLTSTLEPSTVTGTALSLVARLFQADHVSLIQPDARTGEMRFAYALKKGEQVEIPITFAADRGFAGWVLKHRQPALTDDAQSDARHFPGVDEYLGFRTRSLMAAPLTVRDKAIGVVEVVSDTPAAYTQQQLNTLQALAATLAVALENATLYEELRSLLREREQAQAQLIHTEKMAALGRLVASIAHEINNPLQAVQGCLTLLDEEMDRTRRPQEMLKYLGIAESELERVSAIVTRMREFYRPARRVMQPTDAREVIESVLALTNKQLMHSKVVVERNWARGLPQIEANPDHLKQIFLNLVLNAIDAMPSGGKLLVSTAPDQLELVQGKPAVPAVRIEFSDSGGGIPPEVMARLFEPFLTTKDQGSGLGLSVSYGIIQAHHGQIGVRSQPGAGTTFVILLPVAQPSARGQLGNM